MIDDEARELRQRGIREAKAGKKEIAREILQQAIRLDPRSEAAWLWLASVARDNNERVFCLQKLLEINPVNEAGQKALAAALKPQQQEASQQTSVPRVGVPAAKPPPADIMSQAPGVPVPMPDRIAEAQKQAEALARDYMEPLPTTVRWKHKTGNRAGERDIIVFRTYIAVGISAAVLVLIVGLVVLVQTNDSVREIVLGPSATPTPSPTITPTNTPGLTPTPSATPRLTPTPSATPPSNLIVPSPPALPRATDIYPEILERAVYDSAMLLQNGQVSRALPTLAFERRLNGDTRFDPNPYYYEAMALLAQGRYTEAIGTLDSAMERVGERPDDFWVTPFLDSGYAQVYWAMAQQEVDPTVKQETLDLMNDHAQAAVAGDDRLIMPYLILSRAAAQQGAYGDAIETLNTALSVDELSSNTELLLEEAQVYVQQRDYDRALYALFLALYIDPTTEKAYQLKIQIANTRNRPGDAVLAAQDYLYYYPGSTAAFRLLGEARERERKPDMALEAYTQGLAGNSTDTDVQEMLEARARIYTQQRQYSLAQEDYTRLFQISDEPRIQVLRMQAAFNAGDYETALADATDLSTSGTSPGLVSLIRGGALVEQAQPGDDADLTQAVQVLTEAVASSDVSFTDWRGVASEYLARAQFGLNDRAAALDAINAALTAGETGNRHYWRGRILEAQNDTSGAISDYEWVVAWSSVYPFPFGADAQDRLDSLLGVPEQLPTVDAPP